MYFSGGTSSKKTTPEGVIIYYDFFFWFIKKNKLLDYFLNKSTVKDNIELIEATPGFYHVNKYGIRLTQMY
jgi:hypothetical protein